MTDLSMLLTKTSAYKTVSGEKRSGRLSHAYLILTADNDNLYGYLKVFAKLISCSADSFCDKCRSCRLIDNNSHPDVIVFPKKGDAVLAEDVNTLIGESYLKPVESEKKIFIINHAESMNASAQNKLLKTLEEPPENVCILIGATNEFALLQTVKSRVKKLEIPPFDKETLYDVLKGEFTDSARLKKAIACGDGTISKAVKLYSDDNLSDAIALAEDMILNMKSSSNVLEYTEKITSLKSGVDDFLSVTELIFRDMLANMQGNHSLVLNSESIKKVSGATGFCTGAIINALEKITEANERKKFNANPTMLIEWLLFQILEGKYKWQKL